jgi:hypothetical protein
MPDFSGSTALTANQLDQRPLANWKYRRLPFNALVTVIQRATGVSVRETIDAGAQNIKQKSPVQTGGVAGTIPVPQTTPVVQFLAQLGDEIIISNDEVSGLTPTVDTYVNVEPVG